MSQREMSVVLKVLDALSLAGCAVVAVAVFAALGAAGVVAPRWLFLPGFLPLAALGAVAWALFSDIGRGETFTARNSGRLRTMGYLAVAAVAVWLVEIVALSLRAPGAPSPFEGAAGLALVLSIVMVSASSVLAAVSVALSHLTARAAAIKSENDLVV